MTNELLRGQESFEAYRNISHHLSFSISVNTTKSNLKNVWLRNCAAWYVWVFTLVWSSQAYNLFVVCDETHLIFKHTAKEENQANNQDLLTKVHSKALTSLLWRGLLLFVRNYASLIAIQLVAKLADYENLSSLTVVNVNLWKITDCCLSFLFVPLPMVTMFFPPASLLSS